MKRSNLVLLIVATSLVVAGSLIFALGIAMSNFNFSSLDTSKYTEKIVVITEDFDNISIDTKLSEISFLPTEDEKCSVISYEKEVLPNSITLEGDTLVIKTVDERKWYEHISIGGFKTPKLTVYLPKSEYKSLFVKSSTGDLDIPSGFFFGSVEINSSTADVSFLSSGKDIKIKLSTGNADLTNMSAESIDITTSTGHITLSSVSCTDEIKTKVSTGKTKLHSVKCGKLSSEGDTGDVSMTDTVVSGLMYFKRDTGDIKFEKCDAEEINIETSTGNVKGSLLSEKIFVVNTDTGKKRVPESLSGGKCKITTDTGDIIITVE